MCTILLKNNSVDVCGPLKQSQCMTKNMIKVCTMYLECLLIYSSTETHTCSDIHIIYIY